MANITTTVSAAVIETVVSQIVQETLIQESVLIPSIKDMSSMIRPGMDTLDIPLFTALSVVAKAADTDLTPAVPTISSDSLVMNQHNALAWRLEDISSIQSKVDQTAQLLKDGARQMAAEVDDDIVTELQLASAAAPDHLIQFANTPTNTIQETDILEARRLLDVQDVPSSDRFLLLPPDQEKAMLQIDNFIQADRFGNSDAIQNGQIGKVFGIKVLKSTSSNLAVSDAIMYHRDAVAYATQQSAKLETERNALAIAEDFVLSMLYGVQVLDGGNRQVVLNSSGA